MLPWSSGGSIAPVPLVRARAAASVAQAMRREVMTRRAFPAPHPCLCGARTLFLHFLAISVRVCCACVCIGVGVRVSVRVCACVRACCSLCCYVHDNLAISSPGLFLNAIKDIYDKESNPDGYFALCVAENRLCHKLLADKLHEAASSSPDVCTLDVTSFVRVCGQYCANELLTGTSCVVPHSYGDMSGMERFRVAVVNVLTATCVRKATLDWRHLHITAGLSSSLSTMSVLLCDPGDAVLVRCRVFARAL